MAEFKLAIGNPSTKKTYKLQLNENDSKSLYGKKIGEEINGELIGLNGYKIKITGGSDYSGFPMRPEIDGSQKKKIILTTGSVGFRARRYHNVPSAEGAKKKLKQTMPGERRRKSVRGNTISEDTVQINLKVTSAGKDSIEKLLGMEEKSSEQNSEKSE